MGNNESYKQVSTVTETSGNGDDLMFVFHTSDEDSADRVVHDSEPECPTWPYTITSSGRLIAERRIFNTPADNLDFFPQVRPGDAVEFVKPGKRFHWGIYVGDGIFVHMKNGGIVEVSSEDICKDRKARNANNIFKLKTLPTIQIINNARTQLGKPLIWSSSECFVMWCRTGRSEFTTEEMTIQNLDSTSPKTAKGKYVLEIHDDKDTFMQRFSTLSDLIQFRRNVEKFGKDELLTNSKRSQLMSM